MSNHGQKQRITANYQSTQAVKLITSRKIALIRQRTPIELRSVRLAAQICIQLTSTPIHQDDSIYSTPDARATRSISPGLPSRLATRWVSTCTIETPPPTQYILTIAHTGKSDKTLKVVRTRHKKHFKRSVMNVPTFRLGGYVSVDRQRTVKTTAERMEEEPQSKLLPKSAGPFRIVDTTSHKITIREDCMWNVIAI